MGVRGRPGRPSGNHAPLQVSNPGFYPCREQITFSHDFLEANNSIELNAGSKEQEAGSGKQGTGSKELLASGGQAALRTFQRSAFLRANSLNEMGYPDLAAQLRRKSAPQGRRENIHHRDTEEEMPDS